MVMDIDAEGLVCRRDWLRSHFCELPYTQPERCRCRAPKKFAARTALTRIGRTAFKSCFGMLSSYHFGAPRRDAG